MGQMMSRFTIAGAVLFLCQSTAAWAHPHVFVDARAGFLFNTSAELHGLRISWTYDALTSLFLLDALDLDRDNDGLLDDADRAAIVVGETEWPPEFKGDVYLELDGADRPLTRPQNAVAQMEDGLISVAFDLPLGAPVSLSGNTAVLRLYDPIFYYAYTILDGSPLSDGLPDTCTVQITPFEANEATAALQAELRALSQEDVPDQDNVGRLFADEVTVSCR